MAQPTTENLERLVSLLDDGTLRVPIEHRYALDRAAEAMRALQARHTRGKLGLSIG